MKQTAVEWLEEQLKVCASSNFDYTVTHTEILIPTQVFESLFEQAKALHEEEERENELKFLRKQLEHIEHYKLGYKAAQNNLYTEEDLCKAFYAVNNEAWIDYEEWFKQFKK